MGDGRIDLHRFERLFELLLRDHVFHRAHIVQPVSDLDEDDTDVLRHRHEHFAEVFHLLVLAARELHAGELCDALHDIGDLAAELPGDVLVGDGGVLNAVVQQRRDDAVLVQPHLCTDLRGGDAVRHIRRAGLALLPAVGTVGQLKRRAHPAEIDAGVMFQNGIGKLPIALFNNFFCHDRSFLSFFASAQIGDHKLHAAPTVKFVDLRRENDVAALPGTRAERGHGLGKEHAVIGLPEFGELQPQVLPAADGLHGVERNIFPYRAAAAGFRCRTAPARRATRRTPSSKAPANQREDRPPAPGASGRDGRGNTHAAGSAARPRSRGAP